MFSLDEGKTMLPKPILIGDMETAEKLQDQAEKILLDAADIAYKYWSQQIRDGKIKNEYIGKYIKGYIDGYDPNDDSSKMIFINDIISMGDAEGECYDYLVMPFNSPDADAVIRGCNEIIQKMPPRVEKLKKLLGDES